jgi:hypothetical protein
MRLGHGEVTADDSRGAFKKIRFHTHENVILERSTFPNSKCTTILVDFPDIAAKLATRSAE